MNALNAIRSHEPTLQGGQGKNDRAQTMPPKVFISYSHQDERWKNMLVKHLGAIDRDLAWHDGLIQPGTNWLPAIKASMASAQVAVLIVSADFLDSKFIQQQEVPILLRRRAEEGLLVIPIVARPCPWQLARWLEEVQVLPGKGKSLAELGTVKAEKVLSEVATEILRQVQATSARTLAGAPTPTPQTSKSSSSPLPPPVQAEEPTAQQVASRSATRERRQIPRAAWIILLLAVGTVLILGIRAWTVRESGLYLRVPV
ncbi:MAG TPA: toll/interleukin-1 receptor domain-containing protein, partial [Thermoanaerobaculia bacterium]